MTETLVTVSVITAIIAAIVSAIVAPRLRLGRALRVVTAAAIVPLAIIVTVAALVLFTKTRGGQGDMSDLAAAALILIGSLGAAVGFVAGLLAAWAAVHYRRAP